MEPPINPARLYVDFGTIYVQPDWMSVGSNFFILDKILSYIILEKLKCDYVIIIDQVKHG